MFGGDGHHWPPFPSAFGRDGELALAEPSDGDGHHWLLFPEFDPSCDSQLSEIEKDGAKLTYQMGLRWIWCGH